MELKILGGSFTKPGNTTISMDCRFIIPLSIMTVVSPHSDDAQRSGASLLAARRATVLIRR